jgi:hypothetical protein
VRPVEQPELPLLVRGDVVDDAGAGGLPRGTLPREGVLDDPLGKGLRDDGHPVALERSGQTGERGHVVVGRRRGDPIDHRAREGDAGVDPVPQGRVGDGVAHGLPQHVPVVRQVVEAHERHRAGVGASSGVESGDAPRRDVRAGAVPLLSDGERDDGRVRGRECRCPRGVVAARVRGDDGVHDLGGVPVRGPGDERVAAVLGGERLGRVRRPPGERGDPPGLPGRVLGVPGEVRAGEGTDAEVHDAGSTAHAVTGARDRR